MSAVEDVQETIHRLVWESILQKWFDSLLLTIPFLGWPVVRPIVEYLVDTFLVKRLFLEAARWGVFTSIDFKTDEEYNAYKAEAIKLSNSAGDWSDQERLAFRNAARELIRLHPRT